MILLQLFFEFFKVGLFAVGGGLATLPFLYDLSTATGWFATADIMNMIAISESTPGPIGINMATYVGFHTAGVAGSLAATLGLVAPAILIILLIARFLQNFQQRPLVQATFYGLRPASTALIAAAGCGLLESSFVHAAAIAAGASIFQAISWPAVALAAVLLVATRVFKKWHPAIFLLFSAVVGVVFHFAGV